VIARTTRPPYNAQKLKRRSCLSTLGLLLDGARPTVASRK